MRLGLLHRLLLSSLLSIVAACGSDDSEGGDAAPTPTATGAPEQTPTPSAATDGWEGFASPFMASYCVECHGAGDSRDYTTLAHVERDADRIRCGVANTEVDGCGPGFPAPRQFPVGPGARPDDAERDRLVSWIDAGLPD